MNTTEQTLARQITRRAFTGWAEALGTTTGTFTFQDDDLTGWTFHKDLHEAEDTYPGITKAVIGTTVTVGMDAEFMNTYTTD